MDIAVITERYPSGTVKTLLSTVQPLTPQMQQAAEEFDQFLHKRISALEERLAAHGLLQTAEQGKATRGDVRLWHAVGVELNRIVEEREIRGARYRRWLWEAIANLHASDSLKRAERGRTRMHFEYCYRLGRFPVAISERMNWGEWVYFFDSLTVRGEPRADEWVRNMIAKESTVDRRTFRRFTETLNRTIRKKDTSVLSDQEVNKIYESVWESTKTAEAKAPTP